jgi:hypothetical protein
MSLIDALRSYQQADEEGVIVKVSRQACDEAATAIEELTRQRDMAIKHIAEWCVAIDINGSGWDEYYKDAMFRRDALPEIRGLLFDAIESARKQRASW